jgi:hypothetical protein
MALNLSKDQMAKTYNQAKRFIGEHKHTINTLTQGVEAFAAPLVVGLGEGYFSPDARINVAGVPLQLGLGVLGLAGSASGYLDDYGTHAGNMASGLLGAYGAEIGREMGLTMRAKAGKPVKTNLLPANKLAEINASLAKQGKTLQAATGYTSQDLPSQYVTFGATPGPLSPAQLEQMVSEAAAATP